MSGEACIDVWKTAGNNLKAENLDAHSPNCACEVHSLGSEHSLPVTNDEIVIRIIVSPDAIELDTGELLRNKLTSASSSGISLLRHQASDAEIKLTIEQLTKHTQEPNELVGAAVMAVSKLRELGSPERWFCIYDTFSDNKPFHADILATSTTRNAASKSAAKKEESTRRKALQATLQNNLIFSDDADELIKKIRAM